MGGGSEQQSSWYQKLRGTAAGKRDGAGASNSSSGGGGGGYDLTVRGSVAAEKNATTRAPKSGAALPQRMGVSDKDKEISSSSSAAAGSLIENHLRSRKEPPWDQDFSSMSSCRSDLDGNNPGRRSSNKGGEEEDHDALPPLLRNPHIAEFDIVEACSTSSSDCCSDPGGENGEEEEGDCDLDLAGSCSGHGGGWARKRRNHNDNSFSACLPSEIKGVVADSIPLVKYSHNPYQDFRDSMLEMIREKGLQQWCDLEELLFCYLSLNSPEHHEVIKQSFSDVWQDLGSSSARLVGLGEED
ncbi:uncharacterized protein LOC112343173 [Selaginella moellendorffii]|uniref:uncharacterized protein LOC112343173 n=1 Tax=Selaginella moellendorffii TaxID=88036 RepID=UPI000D1CCA5A|nr:uncharacterized protein LOC112343173 [Selaginella moellendorffii]|eukprot:XP_024522006.1 uncharacterized protein LOC112343173 [Selaginella moellendorffii]